MDKIKVEKPSESALAQMGVKKWPIWEKEASKFDWHYDDRETCYILAGDVTVTSSDGTKTVFGAGDLVVFPRGLKCTWEIRKAVRKHYNFG